MALPQMRVEVAFDTTFLPQYAFLLDDPIQGQLDNNAYLLGGPTFIDISQFLKSVAINRGKSRLLDRYESGASTITFDNSTRVFDPFFEDSPFFGAVTPRLEIKVFANDIVQYTGVILDWNIEYELSGDSNAIAICSDKFTNLAQTNIDIFFPDVQFGGARIETILDLPEVNFDAVERNISTGLTELTDDAIPAGTNALDYLQQIEATEQGNLFIAKNGDLTFIQRNTNPDFDTLFSDDGAGIPFVEIGNVFGSELLYNRIVISPASAAPVVRTDATSITAYGASEFSLATLHNNDEDAEALADFLLTKYRNPTYRFDRLSINLTDLSSAQVETLLELEINSGITIRFTPSGIGDPIEQAARVIGFNHSVDNVEYILEILLESVLFQAFVLDSTTLGVLNDGTLGF